MDVTLVLAHDMTDDILEPALDLLFSDDWHRLRGEDVIFQPFEEPPPASRWFSRLCADIGDATAAALADLPREGAELLLPIAVP